MFQEAEGSLIPQGTRLRPLRNLGRGLLRGVWGWPWGLGDVAMILRQGKVLGVWLGKQRTACVLEFSTLHETGVSIRQVTRCPRSLSCASFF